MENKNKRLEKIFRKKGGRGLLKPVDNLDSSHFVLVEHTRCSYENMLFKTEDYKAILERGETYPPDIVHFLVISNKRNAQNIKNTLTKIIQMKVFSFDSSSR